MYPIILNSFISDPVDHIILVLEFIPRAHFLLLEKVVLLKLQIMQQTAKQPPGVTNSLSVIFQVFSLL